MRFLSSRIVLSGSALALLGCGEESVVDSPVPEAAVIALSAHNVELDVGETFAVLASVLDQHGASIPGAAVVWSSEDDDVATVSGTGLIEAVSEGSTDIFASYKDLDASVDVDVRPASAPTLVEVTIDPASATLEAGERQQFTAAGRLSDDSPTAVQVTYIATGGTITGAGLYTAGGTPGGYRVIATETGGSLADTAEITIVDDSSGGFVELYRLDSFAGRDLSTVFSENSPNDGSQSIEGDWFRQTIPPGASGGWAEIFFDGSNGRPASPIDSGTVRWSARVRLSPNWGGKGRLLHFAGTPPNDFYAAAGVAGQCPSDGNGGDPNRQFFILRSSFAEFEPGFPLRYYDQFVSQTGTKLANCYGVTGSGGGLGTANYYGGDFLPVGGADFVLTNELMLNTPGQEDGYHRMYIDGVLRAEFPNIQFRGAGSDVVLTTVGFKPYISSGGNPVGADVYVEFSELLLEYAASATPGS